MFLRTVVRFKSTQIFNSGDRHGHYRLEDLRARKDQCQRPCGPDSHSVEGLHRRDSKAQGYFLTLQVVLAQCSVAERGRALKKDFA
jgi:hypothetical protein